MSDSTARKFEEDSAPQIECRPFVKWAGGKRQLLPQLMQRLPQRYNTYFEPFLGGAALFFRLQPKKAYLSDINRELINLFGVVKDDVGLLIEELKHHRYEEQYYYTIRDLDRLPEFEQWNRIQKAARLIYLNKTCYNGLYRVNSSGHFNTPFGRYTDPTIVDEDNLRACHRALRGARLVCGGFELIEFEAKKDSFVYFDPPYAPVSKTANFANYSKDGFGEEQHVALRNLCSRLDHRGVKFMLTNADTPFVEELYSSFKVERVAANRAINSKASLRGPIFELVITNY
jgi:DNA adenine methylase